MKTVLIQNFHPANTLALVRDFVGIGYKVLLPIDNWNDQIRYFFSNEFVFNKFIENSQGLEDRVELVTWRKYRSNPADDVLIACFEQMDDFERIAKEYNSRILLHVAGNNVPYRYPLSDHLLSPDIQTFNNYPAKNKMLYFFNPSIVTKKVKDLRASFDNKVISDFIHHYSQYWALSYSKAIAFEEMSGVYVQHYGFGNRDGELTLEQAQDKMVDCYFQLYFKEKDCYGNSVLESMYLGTPVIALREFIHDKTLGMFFLNEKNAIIGDSVEDCVYQLRAMTFERYVEMSRNAMETIIEVTNTNKRLKDLTSLLSNV